MSPEIAIAAVIAGEAGGCDEAVLAMADALRKGGFCVRGLVQAREESEGCGSMALVDLNDGTRYPITQQLGSGSQSCALDPGLLAEAGQVMKRIIHEGADLAVFNRFGALEASGEGFHAEMLTLMTAGIPVLVIVPDKHLTSWRHFTGGLARELPPDAACLLSWFAQTGSRNQSPES